MANQTSAVIVNLTEQNWILHRSFGTYRVRGREEGEAYALTRVEGRTAYMDLGDKRTSPVHITAAELASDLCREINSDGGEDSNFCAFVAGGGIPTHDEVPPAQHKLTHFFPRLV